MSKYFKVWNIKSWYFMKMVYFLERLLLSHYTKKAKLSPFSRPALSRSLIVIKKNTHFLSRSMTVISTIVKNLSRSMTVTPYKVVTVKDRDKFLCHRLVPIFYHDNFLQNWKKKLDSMDTATALQYICTSYRKIIHVQRPYIIIK